jgi:hypothetical protein
MKLYKKLLLSAVSTVFALSATAQDRQPYGKEFDTENAIAAEKLSAEMGEKKKLEKVVLYGEISEVCQAEGCWMKLQNEAGAEIFVKFKDHAFVIPKDLAGRKAYVTGNALKKVVSVEDQKHYAEDGGKSEDEIAAITEPKEELRVEAVGVIIEN